MVKLGIPTYIYGEDSGHLTFTNVANTYRSSTAQNESQKAITT